VNRGTGFQPVACVLARIAGTPAILDERSVEPSNFDNPNLQEKNAALVSLSRVTG